MYVSQLSIDKQKEIEQAVRSALIADGLVGRELEDGVKDALDSKLDDLSELIDVKKYR